jgi:hypothetical protein
MQTEEILGGDGEGRARSHAGGQSPEVTLGATCQLRLWVGAGRERFDHPVDLVVALKSGNRFDAALV